MQTCDWCCWAFPVMLLKREQHRTPGKLTACRLDKCLCLHMPTGGGICVNNKHSERERKRESQAGYHPVGGGSSDSVHPDVNSRGIKYTDSHEKHAKGEERKKRKGKERKEKWKEWNWGFEKPEGLIVTLNSELGPAQGIDSFPVVFFIPDSWVSVIWPESRTLFSTVYSWASQPVSQDVLFVCNPVCSCMCMFMWVGACVCVCQAVLSVYIVTVQIEIEKSTVKAMNSKDSESISPWSTEDNMNSLVQQLNCFMLSNTYWWCKLQGYFWKRQWQVHSHLRFATFSS